MRTVLNVLNFVLGGFFTTLGWLLATLVSVILIFTLPLTRSCWEITKLSFLPYGNEAIHVNELYPEKSNALFTAGGALLNIVWFILFGWWLCLSHITAGIVQCMTIIGIPVGITILKLLPSPYGQLAVESFRWKWRSKPEWLMLNASIGNTEFFCFRGFCVHFRH